MTASLHCTDSILSTAFSWAMSRLLGLTRPYISQVVARESPPLTMCVAGGCCGSTSKKTVVGGWAWAWWLVTDVQRYSILSTPHTKLPPRLLDYKLQNKEFTLKPFTSLHRSSLVRFKTLLNFIKSFLYQRNFQLNLNVKTLSCISLYLLQIVTGGDDSKPHL